MRTLIISDIHGNHGTLQRLLDHLHYRPGLDRLVLCGDYVAPHRDNIACLDYLSILSGVPNVIGLMGNHDRHLLGHLLGCDLQKEDPKRYGYLAGLARAVHGAPPNITKFLWSLRPWYCDAHIIAVHAGIDPQAPDWRDSSIETLTEIREPFVSTPIRLPQVVVFGHTPCLSLHGKPDIWFGQGKIGVDGGAGKNIQLNCLVITNGEFSTWAEPVGPPG